MKAVATPITRRMFVLRVNAEDLQIMELSCNYALRARDGLTMAADPYVGYFKSVWKGTPCLYFSWSGIEFIFQVERGEF